MAKAGEEQNTQCPKGGEGADSHIKKQSISKWELPKQKGARGISVHEKLKTMDDAVPPVASKKGKRGRPSSGLSEQDRKKKHNELCQEYRKKKRNRFGELENKEERLNDFFEKFKISSVEQLEDEFSRLQQKERKLKTLCERLGVTEECLEDEFRRIQQVEIKVNALCEKFGVAQEGLEDEFSRFQKKERKLKTLCEKLGVTEECLEAEFSRFQQTEMKFKTLCEQLGVAQEDLEAPEFRILRQTEIKRNALCEKSGAAPEGLEMPTDDFISMDDFSCFSNETEDEKFKGILKEFEVLLDGQPPAPRGKEAAMNEHINQDAMPTDDFIRMDDFNSFSTETMPMDDFIRMDDLTSFSAETFGSLFDGQPPTLGVEEVIMNEFPDQHKEGKTFPGILEEFGSFFDGQSPPPGRKEAAIKEPPFQYEHQWEDYNDQTKSSSSKNYSLNKL